MNKKMIAAAALSGLLVGAMASKSVAEEKAVEGSKAEKNKCKGHDKDKCKGHEKSAEKNKCKGEAKDKKVGDACSGKDGCNGK